MPCPFIINSIEPSISDNNGKDRQTYLSNEPINLNFTFLETNPHNPIDVVDGYTLHYHFIVAKYNNSYFQLSASGSSIPWDGGLYLGEPFSYGELETSNETIINILNQDILPSGEYMVYGAIQIGDTFYYNAVPFIVIDEPQDGN